ncbi:hypothetical protein [Mesorhizobium sp.]|uniref:hypothetical protein n=1 Tax=Mesorhizobium sp. TaxID=1871066 RepID=UPI001AC1422B|nr:hypothetical protein [Mesorhizobium sp.]MBN9253063.1 hypothetical protein [Mesorhizobium sp.]MBN9271877.1 hypothetical protein [Mesorhizobium sp.]
MDKQARGNGSDRDRQPAPKLSVIVITRDEESCIARCLRSVDFADEIVVVDTDVVEQPLSQLFCGLGGLSLQASTMAA